MFLLLGLGRMLAAQCTLVCNQDLQVALDPAGQALITTQMIAPNASSSCPGALELQLFNHLGQPLPNPLSCSNIGQNITARVRHLATGNFCTSDLVVFDAIAPLASCPDKFIFCHQSPDVSELGMATATDNCTPSNSLDFNYFDTENQLSCGTIQNGFPVLKRIDRNWVVTDESGNTGTCLQRIWLKHIQLSDLVFPPNLDNIAAPALSCGQDPENLDLTGQPSVAGIPVTVSIECEMAVTYSDNIINHCPPAAYTVLRTWTAIDFCTSAILNRIQIIKVQDNVAPEIVPPADITIGTDAFSCSGSLTLPSATASDNCSAVNIVPNWQYGPGYGPFTNIPLGTHIVTYTATDACANASSATMTVTVEDSTPPQAVCTSSLQIALSANGGAALNAGTIGQNSSDNCGAVFFAVSRDAENFAPQVFFDCADIGQSIQVLLRVTDEVGLENFCETDISVRDFLKPNLLCPAAATINCLQDPLDLALTGQATATDNCQVDTVFYQDNPALNACNIGSIQRVWKAIDAAGNLKSCTQNIVVNAVNTTTVTFPGNFVVNNCTAQADMLPDATGWPSINGQACSALSVNFTDHIFNGIPGFCTRILRDWKVVDHCVYDPNGGTAGVWEHTQVIDIVDNVPPVMELPLNVTVYAEGANCMAQVSLPDVLATDCSGQVTIGNNSVFANASAGNASGEYPVGHHVVTFLAVDACGNQAVQTLEIDVLDRSAPVAQCFTGGTVTIAANGLATLLPAVVNNGSYDNCSASGTLQLSVAPQTFTCQTLGIQVVTLSATDEAGNTATCSAEVNVKDNIHFCDLGAPTFVVEGTIRTPSGVALRNIPVRLAGSNFEESLACDTLGVYAFQEVPPGDTFHLSPYNNNNWLNGVTTFDLLQISKHILGISPLGSPQKMIAADANRSNSITTFDIVQFRKLLLGIYDSLPGNNSWRFIDSSFVFPDTLNPFSTPFPEEIQLVELNSNRFGSNFTALKIGDVNDSTDPANARSPIDTVWLHLGAGSWDAGARVTRPLLLPDWARVEGFQVELEFDSSQVLLENIVFTAPEIFNEKNARIREGNMLALSWDNAQRQPIEQPVICQLQLLGRKASDLGAALKVRYTRLSPEAYLVDNESIAAIALQSSANTAQLPKVLQIYPNPNNGTFCLVNPFATGDLHLRVVDLAGKVMLEQGLAFSEKITVQAPGLPEGIYFAELRANGCRQVGKLRVCRP